MVFKELVIAQEDFFSRHAVSLAATLSPTSSAPPHVNRFSSIQIIRP
jgi:hypothetical protein